MGFPPRPVRTRLARLTGLPPTLRTHDVEPEVVRMHWRIALAAEAAGLLAAALASTVTYVSERKQFGRPIASFQLVQEMLTDIAVKTDAARMLVWRAGHRSAAPSCQHPSLFPPYSPVRARAAQDNSLFAFLEVSFSRLGRSRRGPP